MKIRRVRILPNYRKTWALALAKKVRAFLEKNNFTVAHRTVDATVCIGGDGTIFYANHRKRISGAVLGIGSNTSALCQLRKDNWEKKIVRILKNGKIEKRLTLNARVGKKQISSLNDIVLHTHDYRVITVSLGINRKHYQFEGDGLIASTPAGSTAYAYSAGGKIVRTKIRKIQLVPICPYKRTIKPMVLSEKSKIRIHADRSSDFIIDGIYIGRLKPRTKVFIEKGKDVLFLKHV